MTRLRPTAFRKVHRALTRLGFREARQRGSHVLLEHPDGRRIVLPRHDREDLRVPLLRVLLKQGGIEVDDFLKEL